MKTPFNILALAAFLTLPFTVSAQTIDFSAATVFNSQSQIIDNGSGSVVYAVAFGNNGTSTANVTLPSGTVLPFVEQTSDNGTDVTISSGAGYSPFNVGSGTDTTGNTNLNLDLDGAIYTSSGGATLTLNGLTAGKTYEVQIITADDRGINVGHTFEASATSGTASPLNSAVYSYSSTAGEVGAQETGTFLATGTTETFFATTFLNDNIGAAEEGLQINGLILEAITIPEPSTTTLAALGFCALFLFGFKRGRHLVPSLRD